MEVFDWKEDILSPKKVSKKINLSDKMYASYAL